MGINALWLSLLVAGTPTPGTAKSADGVDIMGINAKAQETIYLLPATSVLSAILLTGYIGGAICTQWRVGDPAYVHIALGVFVWLGLYLREGRIKELTPLRQL